VHKAAETGAYPENHISFNDRYSVRQSLEADPHSALRATFRAHK